jgi:hypothetical protein
VTPPKERAGAFGIVGMAFGLGFVLGPAVGGLLGGFDPRLPFWVAAGLSFANAAYGWFVLPESLPPERRGSFSWAKANPLGALKLLRSQPQLLGLAGANFFAQLAHVVLPSVTVLYAGYRYGWDETAVGFMLAGVGAVLDNRPGWTGAAGGRTPGGARGDAVGACVRPRRLRDLRRRAYGRRIPRRRSGHGGLGAHQPRGAGLDDPPRGTRRAGTAAGRKFEPAGDRGADRTGTLHADVRGLHRPRADLHMPGAPFYVAALLLAASLAVGWRATASK